MMSASSRFFTGKLTMVGFFSRKNWFFMNRFMCSTMNLGSLVSLHQKPSAVELALARQQCELRAAAELHLGTGCT